jgi:hypothetical protein
MKPNPLNLSGGLSPKIAAQLEALPCFAGVSTPRLCSLAQGKMRSKRLIECRLTAMLIIVGNTPLDDEVFQIPPTIRERELDD